MVRASLDADAVISFRTSQESGVFCHDLEESSFKVERRTGDLLEDFIAMKIFAGAPKDIQDVVGVLEISGERIDRDLLQKLTGQYGRKCAVKLQELLKKYL